MQIQASFKDRVEAVRAALDRNAIITDGNMNRLTHASMAAVAVAAVAEADAAAGRRSGGQAPGQPVRPAGSSGRVGPSLIV